MKFAVGGHGYVPKNPNSNVTPSPTNATAGNAGGHDVHDSLMEATDKIVVDSPNVVRKSKTGKMPPSTKTINRETAKSHSKINIDLKIFENASVKDASIPPSSACAGRSLQKRAMKKLKTVLDSVGTVAHKATLLYKYFKTSEGEPIGLSLGVLDDPQCHSTVASNLAHNLNEILDFTYGKNSTDALTFHDTVFLGICPTEPSNSTDESVMLRYEKQLSDLADELSFTRTQKDAAVRAGRKRRAMFDNVSTGKNGEFFLVQQFQRKSRNDKRVTEQMTEDFQNWLLKECPLVIASPNKRDTIQVKKAGVEEKVKVQKYYYTFSKRELYECAIQHPSQGGFSGFRNPKCFDEINISLSSFEKMFPPNLKRMTDAVKEMCGCEICIDFRNRFNALTAFRNQWVKVYNESYQALWRDGDTANANLVMEAKRDFL